jgi:hypothetical protein
MSRGIVVSILPLVAEAQIQTNDSLRGIFGGRNGSGTGLSQHFTFSFPSHYHSVSVSYSFIHLLLMIKTLTIRSTLSKIT